MQKNSLFLSVTVLVVSNNDKICY